MSGAALGWAGRPERSLRGGGAGWGLRSGRLSWRLSCRRRHRGLGSREVRSRSLRSSRRRRRSRAPPPSPAPGLRSCPVQESGAGWSGAWSSQESAAGCSCPCPSQEFAMGSFCSIHSTLGNDSSCSDLGKDKGKSVIIS